MRLHEGHPATSNPTRTYRRRAVFGIAAAGAASAVLAACGGSSSPTATTASGAQQASAAKPTTAAGAPATSGAAATVIPATRAASAVSATTGAVVASGSAPAGTTTAGTTTTSATADGKLPAPNPNVPDAYTKLPTPFKTVSAPPLKNGKVTTFQYSFNPPPSARGDNQYWQELEKRLGGTLEPTFVPYGNYSEKLGPTIAGGSIPDLVLIDVRPAPDLNKYIQQGAFVDLTAYVTGDALKEYPNLARFPAQLWKNAAIKGKIWGVPRPRTFAGNPLIYRQDWAEKVGVAQVNNASDFLKVMTAMTKNDPDGNGKADTFGMSAQSGTALDLGFFQQMWRTPNEWRQNPDGTLTNAIETDESKAAVSFMRDLWAAGGFHPDATNMTVAQCKDNFAASKIGAYNDSFLTLPGNRDPASKTSPLALVPTANVVGLVPPGHDGGKGVMFASNGVNAMTGIPSRIKDQARIKELLHVLDYFAAPFGSEERIFLDYGIEGIHFDYKNGVPTQTDAGRAQLGDFQNLMLGPYVLYSGVPGVAQYVQNLLTNLIAIGVDNPVISAYSPTFATKAGELTQLQNDRVSAIVTGRDPLSAYDQYVKDWRSRGGDTIRKEYQDFLTSQ